MEKDITYKKSEIIYEFTQMCLFSMIKKVTLN